MPLEQMRRGKEFEARYKSRFNVDVQLYAPYAYDAAKVMLTAIKEAGSADPGRYLPALAGIHYQGITGDISFDENGDIRNSAVSFYQLREGKWQYLETVSGL